MAKRRTCMFCGGSPVTSAHILSRRLQGLLPPSVGGTTSSTYWMDEHRTPQITVRNVDVSPFDHQVKRMCWPCNGQWMNAFEAATAETVAAMVLGKSVNLSVDMRKDLCVWLQIAVMLRATQDPGVPAFDEKQHRWVRNYSQPVPYTRMWAVHMVPRPDPQTRHHRAHPEGLGVEHVSFIWTGSVAFVVASGIAAQMIGPRLRVVAKAVVELWPAVPRTDVVWPPVGQVNEEMLLSITTAAREPGRGGI